MALKHLIAEVESKDISQEVRDKAIGLLRKIAKSPKLRDKCDYLKSSESIIGAINWKMSPGGSSFWYNIHFAVDKL